MRAKFRIHLIVLRTLLDASRVFVTEDDRLVIKVTSKETAVFVIDWNLGVFFE